MRCSIRHGSGALLKNRRRRMEGGPSCSGGRRHCVKRWQVGRQRTRAQRGWNARRCLGRRRHSSSSHVRPVTLYQHHSGFVRVVHKLCRKAEKQRVVRRGDDVGDDSGHVGEATNLRGAGLLREDTYIVSRGMRVLGVVASSSQQYRHNALHAVQRVQAADEDTLGTDRTGSTVVVCRDCHPLARWQRHRDRLVHAQGMQQAVGSGA